MVITLIYIVLFLATTLYAWVLDQHPLWTPDFTWFQVVVGTTLCLLAPTLAVLTVPDLSGWNVLRLVYLAFMVGGAPVVIWQVALIIRRKDEIIENERRGLDEQTDATPEAGAHQVR